MFSTLFLKHSSMCAIMWLLIRSLIHDTFLDISSSVVFWKNLIPKTQVLFVILTIITVRPILFVISGLSTHGTYTNVHFEHVYYFYKWTSIYIYAVQRYHMCAQTFEILFYKKPEVNIAFGKQGSSKSTSYG